MATSPAFLHKIHQERLYELLEVDPKGLHKLIRRKDFPTPTDSDEYGPFWQIKAVREWLSYSHYRPLASLLLDWWPDAEKPASYCGAEPKRYRAADPEPAAMLQRWSTSYGATVVVCWPMSGHLMSVRGSLRDWAPDADAYLTIGVGWGSYGPDVWAERGDGQGAGDDEIEWADLARVLGQPAPFWPDCLRHPDLITSWAPGHQSVRHHGVPAVNIDLLLRMAALYPVDDPVHKTMMHYAQVIQAHSDPIKSSDVTLLRERFNEGALNADQLAVAAEGVPVPQVDLDDLPALTRRIAWREVLRRDDVLAEQCVVAVREWNGGEDTSHPHTIEIRRTATGREFLSRLQPSPRLAMFAILDPDRNASAMIDPLTDSPVAIPADEDGRIRASAPNRLPTTSPLAELILEQPIWIRTADGTLYPAPYDSYYGLSWGYSGTGPATLANLIRDLLNDITACGADPREADHTPEGLLALVRHKWPDGTVLTRDQLEAARNGHPELPE